MSLTHRRSSLIALGILFTGLLAARLVVTGRLPDGVAFAVAAVALFRWGYSLQARAIADLRRFRVSLPGVSWFLAAVSFWYSTVIWIWWSRRTPTFPLFLLNDELRTTLFFDWVPALLFLGFALGSKDGK